MKKESSFLFRMTSEQRQRLDQMFQASGKKSLNEFLLDKVFSPQSDQDKVLAKLDELKAMMISTHQADITKKSDTVKVPDKDDIILQNRERVQSLARFNWLEQRQRMAFLNEANDITCEEDLIPLLAKVQAAINDLIPAPKSDISVNPSTEADVAKSDITWKPMALAEIKARTGLDKGQIRAATASGSWVKQERTKYLVCQQKMPAKVCEVVN